MSKSSDLEVIAEGAAAMACVTAYAMAVVGGIGAFLSLVIAVNAIPSFFIVTLVFGMSSLIGLSPIPFTFANVLFLTFVGAACASVRG